MQTIDYPDYVARTYDAIYAKIRESVDSDYYLKKITQTQGKILEIGTGTGRFFTKAIEQGADIYGIDVSQNMINVLKTKLPTEHHSRLKIQDIRSFQFSAQFSLIIAPFRVFAHLLTPNEQLQALNTVYKHLQPGGRFIFDVYVPNLTLLNDGINGEVDFEGECITGQNLKRTVWAQSDMVSQITQVKMRFEWEELSGQILTKDWAFPMRFFFRYELEHLLHRSDFEQFEIFGDFQETPLQAGSKEFVVTAYKPA